MQPHLGLGSTKIVDILPNSDNQRPQGQASYSCIKEVYAKSLIGDDTDDDLLSPNWLSESSMFYSLSCRNEKCKKSPYPVTDSVRNTQQSLQPHITQIQHIHK